MADAKITELSVMVAPALTDLMPVVDDVAGTPETQAIQLQTLLLIVDLLTEEATVDGAADFLLMYDTSAGGVRKVLPDNLSTPTHVHAAGDVTSGTFTDARVAESNVTQHEAALTITESQISDLGTYATTAYVDSAVAGLYDHKGAYNASTNSPDLDTSPSGILKGDAYTVSVAGTFFAVSVEAGDVLIADQDDPTLSTHWTIVNRNIDSSAFAAASHTHAASDIDSGTFTDARVAESNVTQHAAAIAAGDLDIASMTAEATVDGAADYLVMLDATGSVTRKVLIDDLPTSSGDTLPVTDTTGIAKGSVDSTKVVRLEVDGLTTATTRVLTVQDADGTICYTGHVHSASDTTSGQFADARIAESNVTQHEAALSITESQISDFGSYSTVGHAHAASDITSGTLAHERGGLEADVSAYAGVALIDGGTTSEIKYNLTATTDPGVGDDSDDGYSVGSRWINVTLDKEFVCLDATVGAAVWTETTAAGGGGSGGDCCLTVTKKTANYTAVAGDLVVCDATSGAFTITMPASPTLDDVIGIYLEHGNFTLSVTIQGNGKTLAEFGSSIVLNGPGELLTFQYDGVKWVTVGQNGAPFVDSKEHFFNSVDPTKKLKVDLTQIDSGKTIILQPDESHSTNATTTHVMRLHHRTTDVPSSSNDLTEGYSMGSTWLRTNYPISFHVCAKNTAPAEWHNVGVKRTIDATTAPTASDDSGDGYSESSIWIDVTANKAYVCLDASSGAAVWQEIGSATVAAHASDHTDGTDDIQNATASQKGLATAAQIQKLDLQHDRPGIDWTARTATENSNWREVVYANGLFVAVSSSGTNRVMTSPDGITWTARSASSVANWNAVTYGDGLFVATSSIGTSDIMTSPDGITWTDRDGPNDTCTWGFVAYGNGLFVALAITGDDRVATSGKQRDLIHY